MNEVQTWFTHSIIALTDRLYYIIMSLINIIGNSLWDRFNIQHLLYCELYSWSKCKKFPLLSGIEGQIASRFSLQSLLASLKLYRNIHNFPLPDLLNFTAGIFLVSLRWKEWEQRKVVQFERLSSVCFIFIMGNGIKGYYLN